MLNLLIFLILCLIAYYWWHSGEFKALALSYALRHCKQFGLQLLDQSMVIKGLWVERSPKNVWSIRRRYQFEFSSTGEQRYRGVLVLVAHRLKTIDIEAYKIPDS